MWYGYPIRYLISGRGIGGRPASSLGEHLFLFL